MQKRKKRRCSYRMMKTWYINNNNMVILFAKKLIPNLDLSSRYGNINILFFMILIRTKYLENLLIARSLPLYSITKDLFIPGSLYYSKIPLNSFPDDPLLQVKQPRHFVIIYVASSNWN